MWRALDPEKVWVDLDEWQTRLERVLINDADRTMTDAEMRAAVWEFPGPAALGDPPASWAAGVEERLRSRFIEVAMRPGRRLEADGDLAQARETYLRALEAYPSSERCGEALRRVSAGPGGGALTTSASREVCPRRS